MTIQDVEKEVRAVIQKRIDKNLISASDWIAKSVFKNHQDIDGADADWYRVISYDRLRGIVREVVREFKVKPQESPDPQLILPGFSYLQKAYSVTRNEQQCVVPTNLLSETEGQAKVSELRRMGESCFKHAEELERYLRGRAA